MKRFRSLWFGVVLAVAAVFMAPFFISARAHADVNLFIINNFDAEYTLSAADPHGQLHIVENIDVAFTDYNHGIERSIPDTYKGMPLNLHINAVSSKSGAPSSYTTYGSDGNTVIRIGDANRTLTGAQSYTIDYTVSNVVTFYDDHDELYWDINGTDWKQPFEHVAARFHLPKGVMDAQTPKCFTGAFGSKSQACTISTSDEQDGKLVTMVANNLAPGETGTVVIGLNKGIFTPPTAAEKAVRFVVPLLKFLLLPMTVGLWAFLRWWRKGRDPKGRETIVPQYDAPDGVGPFEAGTIIDFATDSRDLTAVLIDLAVRKYIKIIETKVTKRLGKDKLEYTLELTNADFSGLKDYEITLLNGLFTTAEVGTKVELKSLKNKFYTTAEAARKSVTKKLQADGYFSSSPLAAGAPQYIVAFVIFFVGVYATGLLGPELLIGAIITAIICIITAIAMPARTAKGVEAKEHIAGLKLYLQTAEKDRLEKLQAPDAAYAPNAAEPVKTVELFEKLLPFAIALGVENLWAKQFEGIYTVPPDWYSGNWTTFNAVYLTHNIHSSFSAATINNFAAPHSSGSSGFSGGGFSGGGGGGGGGGGW